MQVSSLDKLLIRYLFYKYAILTASDYKIYLFSVLLVYLKSFECWQYLWDYNILWLLTKQHITLTGFRINTLFKLILMLYKEVYENRKTCLKCDIFGIY